MARPGMNFRNLIQLADISRAYKSLLSEESATMLRSPMRWAGGKLRLRKTLIGMLPPHECYVEVFGGAAWVLLGKDPSRIEILNDIDSELVNFFRIIKTKPETFIKSFDLELVSRSEFERLRDINPANLDDVGRARRFYYLIMASWGAELGSPRFQSSVADGGHGNRLIGALKTLTSRIEPVHKRLSTVIIENLDWKDCLSRYDRPYPTNQVVMYLDPPYEGNNINYKHNMRAADEHRELMKALGQLEARFILSTYDTESMRHLLADTGFYAMQVSYAAGMPANGSNAERHRNQELIVTNYDPQPYMKRSGITGSVQTVGS